MTNDKQAESAARKIYDQMSRFLAKRQIGRTRESIITEQLTPIISAEYEPVMEVLREAWHQRRKIVAHTTNVENGNYLTCLICKGESPGGKPLVDEIEHDFSCWVSRAQEIVGGG